jgi:hypothetical protein
MKAKKFFNSTREIIMGATTYNAINLDGFSQSFGKGNGTLQCPTFMNFNEFNFMTFARRRTHPMPRISTIVTFGRIRVKRKRHQCFSQP